MIQDWFSRRASYYRNLKRVAQDFDLILLRHQKHSPLEAEFISTCKTSVLTVHHTLEEAELLAEESPLNQVKVFAERHIGRWTLARSAGIVGVTSEIIRAQSARLGRSASGKPSFLYPNGIMPSPLPGPDARSAVPTFVFVASRFTPWHGLDLLLDSFEADSSMCRVELVGEVPDALLPRVLADSRFTVHGVQDRRGLEAIMATAWCGLSSFALERKSMLEACTLKVREYLDFGIPVFAGHWDSALPSGFPYFEKSSPSLSRMLEFCQQWRSTDRGTVKRASAAFIDKETLVRKLYGQLNATYT